MNISSFIGELIAAADAPKPETCSVAVAPVPAGVTCTMAAYELEALRLLHELLPHDTPQEGLLLGAQDTQRLMMRLLALDCHLQANLFI